jgi:ribosomal protein S18 acetylase RimI-like enzyme
MELTAIAPAGLNDIPQLNSLVNSAYRGESAKKGWTHEAHLIAGELRTDENVLKGMLTNPNAVILKYTQDNTIIGCVYLEKQQDHLYLGMLSVSPDVQAQGIGKKLLHAAELHAEKNNCELIEMTVITARAKLIAWYERNGYYKTGKTKPFHTESRFGVPVEPIEFVVMEKQVHAKTQGSKVHGEEKEH